MISANEKLSMLLFGTDNRKDCVLWLEVLVFFCAFVIFLIIFQKFMNVGVDSFETPYSEDSKFIMTTLQEQKSSKKSSQLTSSSSSSSADQSETNASKSEEVADYRKNASRRWSSKDFDEQWEKLMGILLPSSIRDTQGRFSGMTAQCASSRD